MDIRIGMPHLMFGLLLKYSLTLATIFNYTAKQIQFYNTLVKVAKYQLETWKQTEKQLQLQIIQKENKMLKQKTKYKTIFKLKLKNVWFTYLNGPNIYMYIYFLFKLQCMIYVYRHVHPPTHLPIYLSIHLLLAQSFKFYAKYRLARFCVVYILCVLYNVCIVFIVYCISYIVF